MSSTESLTLACDRPYLLHDESPDISYSGLPEGYLALRSLLERDLGDDRAGRHNASPMSAESAVEEGCLGQLRQCVSTLVGSLWAVWKRAASRTIGNSGDSDEAYSSTSSQIGDGEHENALWGDYSPASYTAGGWYPYGLDAGIRDEEGSDLDDAFLQIFPSSVGSPERR